MVRFFGKDRGKNLWRLIGNGILNGGRKRNRNDTFIVALSGFITMERVGLGLRKRCLRNSSLLGVKKDDGPIAPLDLK
jgi:hypothetical protein